MKKSRLFKRILFTTFCLSVIAFLFIFTSKTESIFGKKIDKYDVLTYNTDNAETGDVLFLSDIPYRKAQIGWETIGLDKTNSNGALSLRLDGAVVTVKKGIWAHATSTVEYDISNYKNYDYFTTYYGLNTTAGNNGNGAKFYIYTSVDGTNWTLRTEENPVALKGTNNAIYARIDIRDANFIKLYVNDNGSNGSDHAVWGDAKLVKEGYSDNVMMTVAEFDKIIKDNYHSGRVPDDLTLVLLQRNFIKNVGQYQLRSFLESDQKNKETLDWFLNNEEALRLWTIGGAPYGTYERSLQVLSNLYHAYKSDLEIEDVTSNGTKYKDLYLKMMLSLSLSHSTNVGLWVDPRQQSDALTRYEIYKKMHKENMLGSNAMFESYTIEEMRAVMFTNIDDEEIIWLRDYSTKYSTIAERFNPYKYINYTFGYGYYKPQYYTQANYDMWNKKYNLGKYGITYKSGVPKLWIVFEEGAVCGGLSKTAANLYGVWGYPARVVGQPRHAAYIYMYNAGGGKNAWQLANSVVVNGWAYTTGGALMNGWGSRYATNNSNMQNSSYLFLAQEAQNEYEKYEQAELILLLEDVYKDDRKMLEKIYRAALDEESINLDAWIGLINLYITDDSKSDEDLIELARKVAEVYTYHPLPMYDMTRRIGSKIKSAEYKSSLMMLQNKTLKKASNATGANTLYYREVPTIANVLLGITDTSIANFSFDGANAGKIVLSKALQSSQVTWKYSIDGGKNWETSYESFVQLTEDEIKSINTTNDIKIFIVGLPQTEDNIYTIDISKNAAPTTISINDLEDRMFGFNSSMEWTLDTSGEWTSFANSNPLFTGDKRVYVRTIASGANMASDPIYFTFTNNSSEPTKKYIPYSLLSVPTVSATQEGNKANIVDGNPNTYWRSYRNKGFGAAYVPAYVIIELEDPRFVNALEYTHDRFAVTKFSNGDVPYGFANNVEISVSMDGTNWTKVATKNFAKDNNNPQQVVFDEALQAKYVKFDAKTVHQAITNSLAIGEITLFEDTTADPTPRATVNYNIVGKTNKDVVAELVNPTRKIKVTNNDGKMTHTFTENGEFTFEFEDNAGNKGTAYAKVDWIDKSAPTVDVSFSTTELTNSDVVATLNFDKDVTILSDDVQIAINPNDNSKTITFLSNDTVELRFQDALGNVGTKIITVDWIDTVAPTAEVIFDKVHLTDGEVVATLVPSEDVTVTNNDGSFTHTFTKNGDFTFEFIDKAGNNGFATAHVDWISRVPEYKINFSNTEPTNKDVTVELELEDGYRLFNNNASNIYTFTDSGTFNFLYKDANGYDGLIPVTVDWIDKVAPTGEFEYSTNTWTNNDVKVTLKPSEDVTIINNKGSYDYTFTENGEFTFKLVDKVGNEGSATAKVDFIDKEKPTATIEYSTKEATYGEVIATIKPSEEVTILGAGKDSYTFKENAEYTFEFVDRAGNKGYATARVNWIKKKNEENTEQPDNKPTKPSENKPTKPSENKPTKPSENKPSNKFNGSSNNNSSIEKTEITYKEYSNGKVIVRIPSNVTSKYNDISLKYEALTLSDSQKTRFGNNSEIYDVSLVSNDSSTINLSNEVIEQRVKLDSSKMFDGVYAVRIDDSVVKLDYEINDNNEVVFKENGLNRYIIAYRIESNNNSEDNGPEIVDNYKDNDTSTDKKDDKNYVPYIFIGVIVMILIAGWFFIIKKNKKDASNI